MFCCHCLAALQGDAEESTGIPFRLRSDRDIVSVDKLPIPLCEHLRKLTTQQGLADMELEFHVLTGKKHPAAAVLRLSESRVCLSHRCIFENFSESEADAEPVPVSFRPVFTTAGFPWPVLQFFVFCTCVFSGC